MPDHCLCHIVVMVSLTRKSEETVTYRISRRPSEARKHQLSEVFSSVDTA